MHQINYLVKLQQLAPILKMTLFCCFLSALSVTTYVRASQDNNLIIQCSDVNNAESCTFDGSSGSAQGLVEVAEGIFEAINNPQATGLCERNGDSAICEFNDPSAGFQLDLVCSIDEPGQNLPSSATCQLENLPADFFSVICTDNADGSGSCTLTSRASVIASTLDDLNQLTPPQISVGTELLSGCVLRGGTKSFQSDCAPMLSALADGTGNAIKNTLAAITPLNADQAIDSSRFMLQMPLDQLQQRLSRLRSGKSMPQIDISGLRFYDGRQWVNANDQFAAATEVSQIDASVDNLETGHSKLGIFLDGMFAKTDQEGGRNEDTVDTQTTMVTLGIDYQFTSEFVTGLAYSTAFSDTNYGGSGGSLDTSSNLFLLYASYLMNDFHIDVAAGQGGDSYEQLRRLRCDLNCTHSFDQTAESEFDGDQIVMSVGAGYDWSKNLYSISPFVHLASIQMAVDEYREVMSDPQAPGAGFALDMDNQKLDLLTLSVGAQFRYVSSQSWGVLLPYIETQWLNELENEANSINASFVGNVATDSNFELTVNEIDSSYFKIGIGSSFQFKNGNSAFVDLKSTLANDDADAFQLAVGWRWEM